MLKLRTDTRYVSAEGKLTQAGVEAIQGQIDAQASASGLAALDVRVTAVETELAGSLINWQTAIAAAGQTAFDFTGIPSWARRVTVVARGLSSTGTSPYTLRVGDGAVVSTGYLGSVTTIASATPATTLPTTGCTLAPVVAATSVYRCRCVMENLTGNTWVIAGNGGFSDVNTSVLFASEITLAGVLDRLRITTVGGADTFDAGAVNIAWE